MRKLFSTLTLGFFVTGILAMPTVEVSQIEMSKRTNLKLKRLKVVEISSGRLYIFKYYSDHRLKNVLSKESFIGVKKGTSKNVDIYVDSTKLPLTIASQLKDLKSSMSLEERIKIGETIAPRLFRFEEDKDSIYIRFNDSRIEVGATN